MLDPIVRARRLRFDLEAMNRLRGPVIDFETDSSPSPDLYQVRFRLRSLLGATGNQPVYTGADHVHHIEIRLPSDYPERLRYDDVTFRSVRIFHPNVFPDGRVCIRDYTASESLDRFVLRLARYIQCDPAFTGLDSPANIEARDFFRAHPDLFPVDRSVLSATLAETRTGMTFNVVGVGAPADVSAAAKKAFVVAEPPAQRRAFTVAARGPAGGSR